MIDGREVALAMLPAHKDVAAIAVCVGQPHVQDGYAVHILDRELGCAPLLAVTIRVHILLQAAHLDIATEGLALQHTTFPFSVHCDEPARLSTRTLSLAPDGATDMTGGTIDGKPGVRQKRRLSLPSSGHSAHLCWAAAYGVVGMDHVEIYPQHGVLPRYSGMR